MSLQQQLLQTILNDPFDLTARSVYADHLDELGGQANQLRAAFIRVQLELDALGPPRPVERNVVMMKRGPDYWQMYAREEHRVGDRIDVERYRNRSMGTRRPKVRHGLLVTQVRQ